MDFIQATDRLVKCHSHRDVSDVLGIDVQRIRQARLGTEKAGHRRPPAGWERAIARLARERAGELVKLAEELEG